MAQLMPESCCASIIIMAMINGFLNELFTNISFNVTCNHCVKFTGVQQAEEMFQVFKSKEPLETFGTSFINSCSCFISSISS